MRKWCLLLAFLLLLTACRKEEPYPYHRLVQSEENLGLHLVGTGPIHDRNDSGMKIREENLRALALLDLGLEDVTPEHCFLLLTTPFWLIGEVYGIDMEEQPEGGMLLEGDRSPTPVIFLPLSTGTYIVVTCGESGIADDYPDSVIFWGWAGESALLPGYGFAMDVGHSIGEIHESFYLLAEGGEERPARTLDMEENGLHYHLSFLSPMTGEPVEAGFTLDSVRVSLPEETAIP